MFTEKCGNIGVVATIMFSTNSEIVLTFETVNIVSPQLSDIKINKVG